MCNRFAGNEQFHRQVHPHSFEIGIEDPFRNIAAKITNPLRCIPWRKPATGDGAGTVAAIKVR